MWYCGIQKKAFTLTELIVVITILTILGSIGFVSLTNFNTKTRDAKRLTDVRTVQTGLSTRQSAGMSLPIPDMPTNILSSGSITLIQWYVWTGVVWNIRMNTPPPIDDTTALPSIIYATNPKQTHFQLLTFLEGSSDVVFTESLIDTAYAAGVFEKRVIKNYWSELWVVLKSDNSPITGTEYDIILNTSESLKVVFSDRTALSGTWNAFATANPRWSCKRLFESGAWKKDGAYTLLISGREVPVYCHMSYLDKNFYDYIVDGDFEDQNGTNWQPFSILYSLQPRSNWQPKTALASKANSRGLRIDGHVEFHSNEYTYIDANKKYRISGKFRSAGAIPSKIYYWFVEYDANFIYIDPSDVSTVDNSETTLTKSVNSSDTIIEFTDTGNTCSVWSATPYFSQYATVAFDIDDSGLFNDLPNRKQTQRTGFLSVVDNWSTCTLTLKSPANRTYPSGTKIRAHYPGSGYNYIAWGGVNVPNSWTDFSGLVQGISIRWINHSYFRRGTKFVRPLILANYQQGTDAILEMDDLTLEVIQ
jgi:prepilin-type N-terminal cleavage/methylation domain-containing protein